MNAFENSDCKMFTIFLMYQWGKTFGEGYQSIRLKYIRRQVLLLAVTSLQWSAFFTLCVDKFDSSASEATMLEGAVQSHYYQVNKFQNTHNKH